MVTDQNSASKGSYSPAFTRPWYECNQNVESKGKT